MGGWCGGSSSIGRISSASSIGCSMSGRGSSNNSRGSYQLLAVSGTYSRSTFEALLTKVLRSEDDGPNSEESGDEGAEMPGERADGDDD